MKKSTIIMALLMSAKLWASPLTVETLLNDPSELDQKITNLEAAASNESQEAIKDQIEKLRWNLLELKRVSSDFKKSESLEEGIRFSSEKGWKNTINVLYKLKNTCADIEKNQNECFLEISEFESFLETRAVSAGDKNYLREKVNDFSKFNQAKLIVSGSFVKNTNDLLAMNQRIPSTQEKSVEKPLITVKISPTTSVSPIVIRDDSVLKVEDSWATFMAFSKNIVTVTSQYVKDQGAKAIVLLLIMGLSLKIYSRINKGRAVKRFYANIFYAVKKNQITAKLYGKVRVENIDKLARIQRPYIDLLASTKVLKSKLDIKLKNNDKKLIIETFVHSSAPIQELVTFDPNQLFNEELMAIEKKMLSLGGELLISNSYDREGKLSTTSFTVVV